MRFPRSSLVLALFVLSPARYAAGQDELPHGIVMRGQPVDTPEQWSGVWEQEVPGGGAVGLILELTTTIRGAATTLHGVPHYESSVQAGVFERHGSELQFGDANYFSDDAGYVLQWDGKRLHIGLNERANDLSTVIVDVRYDAKRERWTGYMRRRRFAGSVILTRPRVPAGVRPSAIVGTWGNTAPLGGACVHVVQRRDGSLAGWSDTLRMPGVARYANGLKPPETSYEWYGEQVAVARTGADLFSVTFNPYSAMCCSRTVFVKVHGSTADVVGEGRDHGVPWRKMSGGTCRNETLPRPSPARQPCPTR